ncbi:mitochondrial carrier protein [Kwoniella heveanensis CBS 569]|uniref:Small ribosomal subunit protein mS29 n=1 Tax=Kwoniella heveanensis BCC8398 TaxID=1296120 RepID=A0A1B9GV20_9TREE|nr:mitochondrial carrier protein [Kwoniella heveanensis BCC8398]OCF41027.1 mitochondrial carrier protein [Kwoniella heveanensis CBS 569]
MRPIVRFAPSPLSRGISTTAPALAAPPQKKAAASSKTVKQGFNQKKKESASGGGGGSGNATIALRFSMAGSPPDLSDMAPLQPGKYRKEHVGKPALIREGTFEKLKASGLPKNLEKELSSSGGPASVIRQSTVELAQKLEEGKDRNSKDARFVLTGERGSGKSMLLLQTVAYACESGWIVLCNPRASEWTNSSSHYVYDSTTQTFSQWQSAQRILSTLSATNGNKLEAITLSSDVELAQGRMVEAGSSLDTLVQTGAKDDRVAVKALDAVMAVLEEQTQYPVLWAIDEAQTLFTTSKYRTADYTPIEPYHLSTPRLALDFIAGRRTFSRGAVITALSLSDPTTLPSPALNTALSLSSPRPITPYTQLDPYHLAHASSGLNKIAVPFGMNAAEASGMFELFARKGWAPGGTDQLFMESFTASGGNPGELARGLERTYLALTA